MKARDRDDPDIAFAWTAGYHKRDEEVAELKRELEEARAENKALSKSLADAQSDIAEEIKHAAACKEQWDAWQATAYKHEQRIAELQRELAKAQRKDHP